MKPRPAAYVPIDRPAQLRALASPARQELFDVLDAAGPCGISELAERLGRAPDSLYFHVRELVRVGLAVEVERKKLGRHVFVVYDAAARRMRIDRTSARRKDLQKVVAGILRLAARDYQRGLAGSGTVVEGPARNHWGARVRGWLDRKEMARVNELLEELNELVRAARPGPGRQAVALAWVLAPVRAKRAAPARRLARDTESSSPSSMSSVTNTHRSRTARSSLARAPAKRSTGAPARATSRAWIESTSERKRPREPKPRPKPVRKPRTHS